MHRHGRVLQPPSSALTCPTFLSGQSPDVRMVSCGADKSIYFQTAEQVSPASPLLPLAIAQDPQQLSVLCSRLQEVCCSPGATTWWRRPHSTTWTWTSPGSMWPSPVRTGTSGQRQRAAVKEACLRAEADAQVCVCVRARTESTTFRLGR